MSHWFKRLVLVAALVISQALYAGHSLTHANGDQADCQVCMQALNGVAAIGSPEREPLAQACTIQPDYRNPNPLHLLSVSNAHPVRAPPLLPV